jgi:MoxR-like ATPase
MTATAAPQHDDVRQLQHLTEAVVRLRRQVAQRIVGQDDVIEGILTAILSGGHALLIGVPGLAKTLMVQTVAETLHLSFNRVQFTPDLMPSDITGTDIIEEDLTTGRRAFRFVQGPIFANIVLADEINRTPPKTQAALLQAMQEHQVTAARMRPRLTGIRRTSDCIASTDAASSTGCSGSRAAPVVCSTMASSSARLGYATRSSSMNRSSCASGSG